MAKGKRPKRKNGEGSLYFDEGRYWIRITDGKKSNGKPQYKYFSDISEELVKAKFDEWKQKQVYTVPTEMSEWTFGAWAEYWFKTIACKRNKITTISDDRSILDAHILPALAPIRLKKLNWLDLQRFYDTVEKKSNGRGGTLSPKTIKNVYIVVNRILKAAKKRSLILTNPNENVELPKVPRKKPERALDIDLQQKVIDYCEKENTAMSLLIIFFMGTGLRLGEALALQWSKVNFEEEYIIIDQQLQPIEDKDPNSKHKTKLAILDFTKTASSTRDLPLTEDMLKVLRIRRKKYAKDKMKLGSQYIDNDLVFGKDDGDFICDTVLRQYFNDILNKLEIPHTRLHDLRHTFATTACEICKLEDVSKYLGHSSIVTTADMYVHVSRKKLAGLAKTMNSRFEKEKEDGRKIARKHQDDLLS